MRPHLVSLMRRGAIAVGFVAGLAAPALATPSGLATGTSHSGHDFSSSLPIVQVRGGGGGGHGGGGGGHFMGGGGGHMGGMGGFGHMGGGHFMGGGHGFHGDHFGHGHFHNNRFFFNGDGGDGDFFVGVAPYYGLYNNYCFYDYYGRYVCPYYPY